MNVFLFCKKGGEITSNAKLHKSKQCLSETGIKANNRLFNAMNEQQKLIVYYSC